MKSVLANVQPGHQDVWVDYKNPHRAPLLFIAGTQDHIMPAAVQYSNAKHYTGEGAVTEIVEFDGPHFMVALPGWEKIADHALRWAEQHARMPVAV